MADSTKVKTCPTGKVLKGGKCVMSKKQLAKDIFRYGAIPVGLVHAEKAIKKRKRKKKKKK